MPKLTGTTVVVNPTTYQPEVLLAGSDLPDWADGLVGDHLLAEPDQAEPDPVEPEPSPAESEPEPAPAEPEPVKPARGRGRARTTK